MKPSGRLPIGVRCRMAARAAWACLRGDAAVLRIPGRPEDRTPGMCRSLGECVRTCHLLEQAEARAADRDADIARSRAAHPSTRGGQS